MRLFYQIKATSFFKYLRVTLNIEMIQAMAMQFRYSCECCNENLGLIYYIN